MIFLVKLRNVVLVSLVFIAVSFLYLGYGALESERLAEDGVEEVAAPATAHEVENLQGIKVNEEAPLLVQNVDSNAQESSSIAESENEDYFYQARANRKKSSDQEKEVLNNIINHPESTAEMIGDAQAKLIQLMEHNTMLTQAESMLMAKDYEQAVVVIEHEKVTVVVDAKTLSDEDMTKIGDIVHRSTGYAIEDIVIIPK